MHHTQKLVCNSHGMQDLYLAQQAVVAALRQEGCSASVVCYMNEATGRVQQ